MMIQVKITDDEEDEREREILKTLKVKCYKSGNGGGLGWVLYLQIYLVRSESTT